MLGLTTLTNTPPQLDLGEGEPGRARDKKEGRARIKVTQLSQRDHAAGWVSYGQEWKLELGDHYGHYTYRSIFNHCGIIGQQSNQTRWKKRKIKAIMPLKVIQGHPGWYQFDSPYTTSY